MFTVMGSLVQATVPIGLLIAAPIAEWLGISAWFIIGGIACVVLAIVMLLYKPMATLDWQGPGGGKYYPNIRTGFSLFSLPPLFV